MIAQNLRRFSRRIGLLYRDYNWHKGKLKEVVPYASVEDLPAGEGLDYLSGMYQVPLNMRAF